MKEYPSIPSSPQNRTVFVFKKMDGSNIRAEWSKKKGFWKFGSRHHLIDETDHQLGDAVKTFKGQSYYFEMWNHILKTAGFQKAMIFMEYWGFNSSHGYHKPDEDHFLDVFDVSADNKGLLLPKDFMLLTKNVGIGAPQIYIGHEKWNDELTQQVRRGKYPGQTFEGVVCKVNEYLTPGIPIMWKVKSAAWLKKLKDIGGTEE